MTTVNRQPKPAPTTAPAAPIAPAPLSPQDLAKKAAGNAAALLVKDGQKVGFGTGSTAAFFTDAVGARLKAAQADDKAAGGLKNIVGVPTSTRTEKQLTSSSVPTTAWDDKGALDLVVDGADEIVIDGNRTYAIKGGGGALLRERAVAERATEHGNPYVLIVDESKVSKKLGTLFPLPVEVRHDKKLIQDEVNFLSKHGEPIVRTNKDGTVYLTDNGNAIIDLKFKHGIANPGEFEVILNKRLNVIDHGLFIDMADKVIIGRSGTTETVDIQKRVIVKDSVDAVGKAYEAVAGVGATNRQQMGALMAANLSDSVQALATLRTWRPATVFLGSARSRPGDAVYEAAVKEGADFATRFWSTFGEAPKQAIDLPKSLHAEAAGHALLERALQPDVIARAATWNGAFYSAHTRGPAAVDAFLARGVAARTGAGPGNMEAPLRGALLEHAAHLIAVAVLAREGGDHVLATAAFAAAQKKAPGIVLNGTRGAFITPQPTTYSDDLTKRILTGGVETQGFGIKLPHEQALSPWVEQVQELDQFFFRMFGLFENAVGHVITPGGFGTIAEGFELWLMRRRAGYDDPLVLQKGGFDNLVGALDKVARDTIGLKDWSVVKIADAPSATMTVGLQGFSNHPDTLEKRITTQHIDVTAKLAAMPSGVLFLSGNIELDKTGKSLVSVAEQLGASGHPARLSGTDIIDQSIAVVMKKAGAPTAQAFVLNDNGERQRPMVGINVSASVDDVVTQKIGLTRNITGVVAGPGDLLTLSTLFSILTDVQTGKLPPMPIVLIGKDYWQPIFDALKKDLLSGPVAMISPRDLDLVTITDDPNVAAAAFPAKKDLTTAGSGLLNVRSSGTSSVKAVDRVRAAYAQQFEAQQALFAGQSILLTALQEQRPLTVQEQNVVDNARKLVRAGISPQNPPFEGIRNRGYGDHQTQISLANPGPGHLYITSKDAQLLDGLVLHHEFINRETKDVAPYRAVDAQSNAMLTFEAAGSAPVTVYYGRPNWQSSVKLDGQLSLKDHAAFFDTDRTTPVNDLSAYAAQMFANGTADVKVAMDGLRAVQTINFMGDVAKATRRRDDQTFSAAFNLNRTLVDDRPETLAKNGGKPRELNPRPQGIDGPPDLAVMREIAMLSVELAKAGGWEKVTLDSASDKMPSDPLMELMSFENLLAWTHAAHSAGLETYISGGMRGAHFADAVFSGVGGVGVGTSMPTRSSRMESSSLATSTRKQ